MATFLGSILADLGTLAIGQLVGDVRIGRIPVDLIGAAAVLNAAIAALLLYPARAAASRYAPDELAAW
jgi:hypothetical protein